MLAFPLFMIVMGRNKASGQPGARPSLFSLLPPSLQSHLFHRHRPSSTQRSNNPYSSKERILSHTIQHKAPADRHPQIKRKPIKQLCFCRGRRSAWHLHWNWIPLWGGPAAPDDSHGEGCGLAGSQPTLAASPSLFPSAAGRCLPSVAGVKKATPPPVQPILFSTNLGVGVEA